MFQIAVFSFNKTLMTYDFYMFDTNSHTILAFYLMHEYLNSEYLNSQE